MTMFRSCFLFLQVVITIADENEVRLMHYLLDNYEKGVKPSVNASQPLNVTFGLSLTQIIDVDERNQILTTNCWLNQNWIDYNLRWNASDFGGIENIRLLADTVWKPDIVLYNNADSQYHNGILSTNVIVASDGNVTWLSSIIFKSSCKIDVSWFPFDQQICRMKFASWTYDGYQINLVIQTEEGDLSNFVESGEWDLVKMIVTRNEVFYSCCKEPYPDITYSIVIRRRPLFYVFTLVLPCVLITGIAPLSFYMPSDSGEKVTLGITTLLSITVFLMVIGESMPPTSDTVPLIGIYYGVTIIMVSFTTALCVVTLNIHHRGVLGTAVSNKVRKLVHKIFGKITFMQLEEAESIQQISKSELNELNSKTVSTLTFEIDRRLLQTADGQNGTDQVVLPDPSLPFRAAEKKIVELLEKICQTIERYEVRLREHDRRYVITTEWQQLALIIDRFLLGVFIFLTVTTTLAVLTMSPYSRLY